MKTIYVLPDTTSERSTSSGQVVKDCGRNRWHQALAILVLGKPGVVALLVFVSMVTALVAADGQPDIRNMAVLLVTGWLAASGAAAINQYLERDVDRLMTRTRGRPLVVGDISSPELVLTGGIALIGGAAGLALMVSPWLALFLLLGALIYVMIYTVWLKRRSPWNIVIGGLAGSCAALSGAAAVGNWWEPVPLFVALLLFLWTPPHFWSLAIARFEDYQRARIPMLPVVTGPRQATRWILGNTMLLVGASLGLSATRAVGPFYDAAALLGGTAFLVTSLHLVARPGARAAKLNFRLSIVYLTLVFGAMLLGVL